ncbi:hypothetical protein EN829_021395 [Mesorhizobium sp. M00.F.Ca.ET.186.01.1.1]|nr:hypothetical protein EN848_29695 [bacterium M00.F.Ca.ET.205.01.1.1]TGU50562.1 hypothetical protein EN795_23440 [bacterium M00.F.Ca.ET.152.01.1.1]TGV34023.1 hypothetical protein EN829_021395 [Mesorhizobium sp. M00.F.Ca.ET.186.01.1.1]TGZ40926.1 hypothetical protein EN805_22835 [bacterium M00.F.Ca.ET.162.01.1.1]
MVDTAHKQDKPSKKKDTDRKAMHLAETTDVSPNQARELLEKHGNDIKEAEKQARNFKAEG